MKTILGGADSGLPKTGSTPEARAATPSAAPRSTERRVKFPVKPVSVFSWLRSKVVDSHATAIPGTTVPFDMAKPYQRFTAVPISVVGGQTKNCTSVCTIDVLIGPRYWRCFLSSGRIVAKWEVTPFLSNLDIAGHPGTSLHGDQIPHRHVPLRPEPHGPRLSLSSSQASAILGICRLKPPHLEPVPALVA